MLKARKWHYMSHLTNIKAIVLVVHIGIAAYTILGGSENRKSPIGQQTARFSS